ncbi:rhodanese-like domain-containing protein [Winogradskyella sp. A2]|uniref:rhodanese-like domain-containing protein n=1 Tax=Winogradskyella sp. A2 TaxID=3366944 RepID=UPI00398C2BB5
MGILSALFGQSTNQLAEYIEKGAIYLDVRTEKEFNTNHIKTAINIPLQELNYRVDEIKKTNKPIIVYCASGMRSANATSFLKQNGIDAINGGGISKVRNAIFK